MSKKLQPSADFDPIFNRLITICEKKNTTVSNLIDTVESSRSAINAWKKGNIAANVLPQITQLLSVSFDYLLTGIEKEKSPSTELTEEVENDNDFAELKDIYIKLSERGKGELIGYARCMSKAVSEIKENNNSD